MKALFSLLRYLLTWQRLLLWLVVMGLVALALTPVVALVLDPHTAFGVFIYGYLAALLLPSLAAPVAFRHLISSRRLALVPGFLPRTGLALLLLALLLGALPVMGSDVYWPEVFSTLFGLRIFIGASLYFALMQWALSSRHMVMLVSLGPFLLGFLLIRTAPFYAPLLAQPSAHWLGAALCCAGWFAALLWLGHRRDFRPVTQACLSNTDYIGGGMGWWFLSPALFYRVRTAAGSLLFGYPDGIGGRLLFLAVNLLLAPLLGVTLLWLMGGSQDWPRERGLFQLYLLFSMISAIAWSASNGELAARCRQLWLRHGGDRADLWRLMENSLLTNALLLGLLLLPQALLAWLFLGSAMNMHPLYDYLLGTLSIYMLGSYFSLAARIYQWSLVAQLLMVLVLGPGVAFSFRQDVVPIPLLYPAVLAAALLFRTLASRRFLRIDWYQVKPRGTSGSAAAR